MKKHINIPIFIPHLGCPNQCVFCNQRTISGVREFDIDSVKTSIDTALSTIDRNTEAEIAFFGGSFTGIDRELMVNLLEIAYSYVKSGRVKSVRCSTRPDYINDEILSILKKYGVRTIELGLQSYDNSVLDLTKRGHNANDEERACELIVKNGFLLVGQMMIGLPGSTPESECKTAEFICKVGAVGARIYPTVVFKDTELYGMLISNKYSALTVDDAVARSAEVLDIFLSAGVEVIRIGLCAQDNLFDERSYAGGPNHPALGELVENELFYNRFKSRIGQREESPFDVLIIRVSDKSLSKAIGQKRKNIKRLMCEYKFADVIIKGDKQLTGYEFNLEYERKQRCI